MSTQVAFPYFSWAFLKVVLVYFLWSHLRTRINRPFCIVATFSTKCILKYLYILILLLLLKLFFQHCPEDVVHNMTVGWAPGLRNNWALGFQNSSIYFNVSYFSSVTANWFQSLHTQENWALFFFFFFFNNFRWCWILEKLHVLYSIARWLTSKRSHLLPSCGVVSAERWWGSFLLFYAFQLFSSVFLGWLLYELRVRVQVRGTLEQPAGPDWLTDWLVDCLAAAPPALLWDLWNGKCRAPGQDVESLPWCTAPPPTTNTTPRHWHRAGLPLHKWVRIWSREEARPDIWIARRVSGSWAWDLTRVSRLEGSLLCTFVCRVITQVGPTGSLAGLPVFFFSGRRGFSWRIVFFYVLLCFIIDEFHKKAAFMLNTSLCSSCSSCWKSLLFSIPGGLMLT